MRYLAILCVLLGYLYAQEHIIRSVEFYNRSPLRFDIMLAFNAPYTQEIKQESNDQYHSIILKNVKLDSDKQKAIHAFGIEAVQISQVNDDVYIILLGKANIRIQAAQIVDGYGLRFRITEKSNDPVDRIKEGLENLPLPSQD